MGIFMGFFDGNCAVKFDGNVDGNLYGNFYENFYGNLEGNFYEILIQFYWEF